MDASLVLDRPPLPAAFGDVNGDGLTDLLCASGVYINQGNDTGWSLDENYDLPTAFEDIGEFVADVNKDGLADIIVATNATTSGGVFINRGDGKGWDLDPNYHGLPSFVTDGIDKGVRMVDVTNDGYPDAVQSFENDTYPSGYRKVFVNNGEERGGATMDRFYPERLQ